jgi:hypothetical protein
MNVHRDLEIIIENNSFYLIHFMIMNIHNLNYLLTLCDACIQNKIKIDIV